jgi:hypothetical protein
VITAQYEQGRRSTCRRRPARVCEPALAVLAALRPCVPLPEEKPVPELGQGPPRINRLRYGARYVRHIASPPCDDDDDGDALCWRGREARKFGPADCPGSYWVRAVSDSRPELFCLLRHTMQNATAQVWDVVHHGSHASLPGRERRSAPANQYDGLTLNRAAIRTLRGGRRERAALAELSLSCTVSLTNKNKNMMQASQAGKPASQRLSLTLSHSLIFPLSALPK